MKDITGNIAGKYGLLIVLVISLVLFAGFCGYNKGLWWDEAVYLSLARSIYQGDGYYINTGEEAFRPPLLPAMAAGIWSVTGPSVESVAWLPPLFSVLSVAVTYLLARRLFGKQVAFWSSLMLATSFQFLFFGERFLTETLFIFLATMALLIYHEAAGRKEWFWFPMAGLLVSLAFLTRYAGLLLFVVYFLYPLYAKRSLLRRWDYWAGILVFMIAIIPWMLSSMTYYGSPYGALFAAQSKVDATYYNYPSYFYLERWINIFGLAGLLIIPGIYVLARRRKRYDLSILIMIAASLVFFMFVIERKEERYLLHYISLFYITAAVGFEWLTKKVRVSWFVPAIVSLIVVANIATGVVMMQSTRYSSQALTEAGKYLEGRIQESQAILSNNEPPLYYLTDRLVYPFPESEAGLQQLINEKNISFIVIDIYEPTYPEWVWSDGRPSEDFGRFALEGVFQEYGTDIVWVFRTR